MGRPIAIKTSPDGVHRVAPLRGEGVPWDAPTHSSGHYSRLVAADGATGPPLPASKWVACDALSLRAGVISAEWDVPMPHLDALHFELSRQALGTSQAKLGETFGVSRRTAQRWASRGTHLPDDQMLDLIRLVHPHDAQLAAVLAATMGSTLEGLGVVKPAPPPLPAPAPAPPPPPPAGIVE